ncbi:UNVERIFIED_CONTAM: hypothetical protein FKN15_041888 [Acipenser sinensis]
MLFLPGASACQGGTGEPQFLVIPHAVQRHLGDKQELAFLFEDMESDSMSSAVKLSLSAELLPLIQRATAVLQVSWSTQVETRQSIFDDQPTTSPVMAVVSQTLPLGLLRMHLLQAWLNSRVFQPTLNGDRLLTVSHHCLKAQRWAVSPEERSSSRTCPAWAGAL